VSAPRTTEQLRTEIEAEREQLAGAVEHLRDELGTSRLQGRLPVLAAGAAAAGFVLAGGIGATARYFARRGREL
jgi:hypothetical protein